MAKRIAVLVSGGGTNLQALIDAQQRGELGGGEIAAVISTKAGAYALERAANAGIAGYVLPRKEFDSNQAMTLALVEKLKELEIDLVVLAGCMIIFAQELVDRLTEDDKSIILKAFIRDMDRLKAQIAESGQVGDKILILTDPLCTLDVRERIFRDIIAMYEPEGTIFLKPHPRDELDYRKLFAEYPQFDATVPMEMLNFFPGLRFKKVVAVLTEIKAIQFADEVVRLGEDFMDKYEDPLIHRQNEQI